VLRMTGCLAIVNICAKYLQNPLMDEKPTLYTCNRPFTLRPPNAILNLVVEYRVLRLTRRLMIVKICVKK
jgi:hypothetical protein